MFLEINVFASLFILHAVYSQPDSPTVITPLGKLQGTHIESAFLKRKAAVFYGVPYAKPPIGELRFKEPQPTTPWSGTLLATKPPSPCTQMDIFDLNRKLTAGSEDCLYMNIFTPKLPEKDSKLMDVIFYIHGGGFVMMSMDSVGFERFMDEDVVVVAMNYRLGALGFLSTQDEVVPGNNGLKDQQLALKWVKENIQYFGGDPNKITITGFSAGAASVHFHMLSPMSKGMFHRAVLESGTALSPWAVKRNPRREAEKLAKSLHCSTEDSKIMVDCLRKLPATEIIYDAQFNAFKFHPDFLNFVPCVEPQGPTAFLTEPVKNIMEKGDAADVPVLLSFSRDEGMIFIRAYLANSTALENLEMDWSTEITRLMSGNDPDWIKRQKEITVALRKRYIGDKSIKENLKGLVRMISDWAFLAGIEETAEIFAQVNKSPVYTYQFLHTGKINPATPPLPDNLYQAVGHCEQSQYATPFFGNRLPEDDPMAEPMMNMWMSFIKGKDLHRKWKTVNSVVPKFGIFNIESANWEQNEFQVYENFSGVDFWKWIDQSKEGNASHEEM